MGGRGKPSAAMVPARPRATVARCTPVNTAVSRLSSLVARVPARMAAWAPARRVSGLSSLLVVVLGAGALVSSSLVSAPGANRTAPGPHQAQGAPVPGGSGATTTGPPSTTNPPGSGSAVGGPGPGGGSRTTSTTGPPRPARHGGGTGPGGAGSGGAGGGSPSGSAGGGGGGDLWTNLLSAAQSLFNGSTASWSGVQSHVAWVAAPALGPAGALRVTSTGAQAMWAMSGTPSAGGLSPAAPGTVYAGEAEVRAAAGALTVQPVIGFYDAAGTYLTSVWGQGTQAGAGTWAPVTAAVAQAPARTAFVGLGLVVYATQPGQAIYLVSPGLLRNAGPTTGGVDGPLHVRANQVVQANGQPVVLRGLELYGLDSSSSPASVTGASVAAARAWGADVMRVALGEQLWLPTSCAYDPSYVAAVDRAVTWITSAGMVALLELQDAIVSPGCPAGGPHNMADNPGSLLFWSQVASRYASNPLVAFDLYNEPHDISDAVWLSGGPVTDTATGATYEAAGMQQLYDAVRAAGAHNVVVVSGNNWANTVPSALVQGTNIVYGVHAYTCPQAPPPSCAVPDPTDPTRILSQWVGVGASSPIMVSEFGWPSTADGTYMANVIAYAAAHGWGWNAFAWDAIAPFGLVSTDPSSATAEPSPSGMPVLAALASTVGAG